MKGNRSINRMLPMLVIGVFVAVVLAVSATSQNVAWALTMTKETCQRCHGVNSADIVDWHHQVRDAKNWSCTLCHKTVSDGLGGYTLEIQRDCTVCHTPGYHTEPAGTNPNRHHAIRNVYDYGCMHCHPVVQNDTGDFEVVVTRDCFFCHTDGERPWRTISHLTNLPTSTSPDNAATITNITSKFRDTLMYDYNEIANTATVDSAITVRLDKDAATTSKVTLGFYVFELPNASGTIRIYPYLLDGVTVDTSTYLDFPVSVTGWTQCDVTSVAMKMSGFSWMKFRMTAVSNPLRLSEGSFRIIKPTTIGTNQIPVAQAGSDQIVNTGDTVNFSGYLSSDPDGSIVSYEWDFGDGSLGIGRDVSHVYTAAGAYLVGLKITDNLGATAEDFAFVNVKTPSLPPNIAPVANAGTDLKAVSGQTVILSGAASSDPDGQIARWDWSFDDGTSASGESVNKVYNQVGTYTATLTVTDTRGAIGTDIVVITVTAPKPGNIAPTANAGPDTYESVGATVAFSGAASADPDGTIASYNWDFGDGKNGTGIAPTKIYSAAGVYVVTLTVTDNAGAMATDTVTVTIHDVIEQNQPPVATTTAEVSTTVSAFSISQPTGYDLSAYSVTPAGATVNALKGQIITFSAAGSTDMDGAITSYKWNFGDGTSATGITVQKAFNSIGNFTVILTVTDNRGSTGTYLTKTCITAPVNKAPIANAGPDVTATVNKSITLSAAGSSDPDGTIASYSWKFSNSSTITTGVSVTKTFSSTGTYTATLTVKDNQGATTTDTVTITVVSNQAPIANAGPDKTATVGQSVSFSGAGSSDPDGSISSYTWNFGNGSTGSGVSTTKTYTSAGTYTVTLTVKDNGGKTATDTAIVTVTAIVNPTPVANAGADKTATTGQAISFSGSASTAPSGRTITAYSWNFGDTTTATGVSPTKTYTTAGTYTVTLTVTDSTGATATDTAIVTVTAAATTYVSADLGQHLTSLSSRTNSDPSSPTNITTKLRDAVLTDTYRIDRSNAVAMKVNRDANTTTQVILRVYISSISNNQTLRIYPYNSNGTSLNTSYYVDASASARGWKEIDVTTLAAKMRGFGWMKFRVTDGSSVSIAEGNFTIR